MHQFFHYLTLGFLWKGLLIAVEISVASFFAALPFALGVALMRMSNRRVVRWLPVPYIWVMRGTPILLQLLFWYNVLPLIGIRASAMLTAIIGLALNEIAFMAEIIRGGLLSVKQTQRDAAAALGFKPWQILQRVVIPQAHALDRARDVQRGDHHRQEHVAGVGDHRRRAHPSQRAGRLGQLRVRRSVPGRRRDVSGRHQRDRAVAGLARGPPEHRAPGPDHRPGGAPGSRGRRADGAGETGQRRRPKRRRRGRGRSPGRRRSVRRRRGDRRVCRIPGDLRPSRRALRADRRRPQVVPRQRGAQGRQRRRRAGQRAVPDRPQRVGQDDPAADDQPPRSRSTAARSPSEASTSATA